MAKSLPDQLLRHAVPLHEAVVAHLQGPAGDAYVPVARVDARKRPDIRDLTRALRAEGGQAHIQTQWVFALDPTGRSVDLAILNVEYMSPLICRFAIAFGIVEHHDFLDALKYRARFALTTQPITETAQAVSIQVGLPELVRALQARQLAAAVIGARG